MLRKRICLGTERIKKHEGKKTKKTGGQTAEKKPRRKKANYYARSCKQIGAGLFYGLHRFGSVYFCRYFPTDFIQLSGKKSGIYGQKSHVEEEASF